MNVKPTAASAENQVSSAVSRAQVHAEPPLTEPRYGNTTTGVRQKLNFCADGLNTLTWHS